MRKNSLEYASAGCPKSERPTWWTHDRCTWLLIGCVLFTILSYVAAWVGGGPLFSSGNPSMLLTAGCCGVPFFGFLSLLFLYGTFATRASSDGDEQGGANHEASK